MKKVITVVISMINVLASKMIIITNNVLPRCSIQLDYDNPYFDHHDHLDHHAHQLPAQMQQLLAQGAACNVHYLFSMDTDQLTGPQVA